MGLVWFSRLFSREPCSTCELYKLRCDELKQLLAEEREDRRKTEDAWRANVASAKPVFEQPEPVDRAVNASDEEQAKLLAADIEEKAQWAARSGEGWAVAQQLAQVDWKWQLALLRARAIREEHERNIPVIDDEGEMRIQ